MAFDGLIDGVEAAVAPATFEAAICCIISTNAPRLSLCSSTLAPSGSSRQARPIAARSERAPKSSEPSKDAPLGVFCVPVSDVFNHAPRRSLRAAIGCRLRTGWAPPRLRPIRHSGTGAHPSRIPE